MHERALSFPAIPRLARRAVLATSGALLLPGTARAGIPPSRRLTFEVIRKGDKIGTHVIDFAPAGPDLAVKVSVDIAVKFGAITLYRYALRAAETWKSGVLLSATGQTNDDGTIRSMRATNRDGRLFVESTRGPSYTAPEKSICASHWNLAEMAAPMIDLQDGELLDFKVDRRGPASITAAGGTVQADHFALSGPAVLELWYDRMQVWSKLRAVARDGSIIDYQQV